MEGRGLWMSRAEELLRKTSALATSRLSWPSTRDLAHRPPIPIPPEVHRQASHGGRSGEAGRLIGGRVRGKAPANRSHRIVRATRLLPLPVARAGRLFLFFTSCRCQGSLSWWWPVPTSASSFARSDASRSTIFCWTPAEDMASLTRLWISTSSRLATSSAMSACSTVAVSAWGLNGCGEAARRFSQPEDRSFEDRPHLVDLSLPRRSRPLLRDLLRPEPEEDADETDRLRRDRRLLRSRLRSRLLRSRLLLLLWEYRLLHSSSATVS